MYRKINLSSIPAGDRFAVWHDSLREMHAPIDIRTDDPAGFRGGAESLDLGTAQVGTVSCSAVTAHRTQRMISPADPAGYHLNVGLRGRFGLDQGGRSVTFSTGDLVVYKSWQPFWATSQIARGTAAVTAAYIPRELVRLPDEQADRLDTVALSAGDGIGALLAHFITRVARDAASYQDADTTWLSSALVDLFSAALAHRLDAVRALPAESRRHALQLQVRDHIERRLHDPALSPAGVAAANHLSLRSLQRLFEDKDISVAGWIRSRRLENCRRDLADPHRQNHPIRAIAARWGYPDPANFTRAFRTAYGLTPGEFRSRPPVS
jgi:AraC-like DNA-binding protein